MKSRLRPKVEQTRVVSGSPRTMDNLSIHTQIYTEGCPPIPLAQAQGQDGG